MTIADTTIAEARTRQPLSVIIGREVKLRRIGGEYEGLCPFHNDRRPSLNVNDKKALWLCRSCGAGGDAISFVERFYSKPFADAVAELIGAPYETGPARFERELRHASAEYAEAEGRRWEPNADERGNMKKAARLWSDATDPRGTLAQTYLRSRGINLLPVQAIRFVASLPFWHTPEAADRPVIVAHHPALLAAVQARNGEIIAVQRIYLSDDGGKAPYEKPKKVMGPMHDGAVRLAKSGRILGIAEGVETSLAAMQLFSVPVWATLGHKRLTAIALPRGVEQLVIFADNGRDGKVDPAAMAAAEEYDHRGIAVVIEAPEPPAKDWNDVLLARRGQHDAP